MDTQGAFYARTVDGGKEVVGLGGKGEHTTASVQDQLTAKFRQLDQNNDGGVKPDELQSVLMKLNPDWTAGEIEKMFTSIDADKNGYIDVKEWMDWMFKGSQRATEIFDAGAQMKALESSGFCGIWTHKYAGDPHLTADDDEDDGDGKEADKDVKETCEIKEHWTFLSCGRAIFERVYRSESVRPKPKGKGKITETKDETTFGYGHWVLDEETYDYPMAIIKAVTSTRGITEKNGSKKKGKTHVIPCNWSENKFFKEALTKTFPSHKALSAQEEKQIRDKLLQEEEMEQMEIGESKKGKPKKKNKPLHLEVRECYEDMMTTISSYAQIERADYLDNLMKVGVSGAQAEAIFKEYDADGNGELEMDELVSFLERSLGPNEVKALYRESIGADLDEVKQMMEADPDKMDDAQKHLQKRLIKSFRTWDENGDGSISFGEMTKILLALDPSSTDVEIYELLQAADKNKNGSVDVEEFINWLFISKK